MEGLINCTLKRTLYKEYGHFAAYVRTRSIYRSVRKAGCFSVRQTGQIQIPRCQNIRPLYAKAPAGGFKFDLSGICRGCRCLLGTNWYLGGASLTGITLMWFHCGTMRRLCGTTKPAGASYHVLCKSCVKRLNFGLPSHL